MTWIPIAAPAALLAFAVTNLEDEHSRLIPDDEKNGQLFGTSVSLSGDTALVGARVDSTLVSNGGAAYAFVKTGSGWSQQAKLTPADLAAGDEFGIDVDLDGDLAVVGSYLDDDHGTSSGSAYVFLRTGTTWTQDAKLVVPDGAEQDRFGLAVAVDGETIVVGVPGDDDVFSGTGSAYVFVREQGAWKRQAKLMADPPIFHGGFGAEVAVSGDFALVSAPDQGGDWGAVYAFERTGTQWSQVGQLMPAGQDGPYQLGLSIRIDGDTAVLGAPNASLVADRSGGAFVFENVGGSWVERATLLPLEPHAVQHFGYAVSIDDGHIVCGSYNDGDQAPHAGSAEIFEGGGSSWTRVAKLVASDAAADDRLGSSVALGGQNILVGAPSAIGDVWESGVTYFYSLSGPGLAYCSCWPEAICANVDEVAGCRNSTGAGAQLTSSGSASISADDLVLTVSGVPQGEAGLFLMGGDEVHVPLADGWLCVAGGISGLYRFPAQTAGSDGVLEVGPALVAFTHANFAPDGHVMTGQTWNFQAWYRDAGGPCGHWANTSNALSVLFTP